jgi:hypothetical protein
VAHTVAVSKEEEEKIDRVIMFGETGDYFAEIDGLRLSNMQLAVDTTEHERAARQYDAFTAQARVTRAQNVTTWHSDKEAEQERLNEAHLARFAGEENQWRRRREAARARLATNREQLRQIALWLVRIIPAARNACVLTRSHCSHRLM